MPKRREWRRARFRDHHDCRQKEKAGAKRRAARRTRRVGKIAAGSAIPNCIRVFFGRRLYSASFADSALKGIGHFRMRQQAAAPRARVSRWSGRRPRWLAERHGKISRGINGSGGMSVGVMVAHSNGHRTNPSCHCDIASRTSSRMICVLVGPDEDTCI